ncbi:VOC family protein [Virgibacillus dakarensis]|uniref:VOC family protein n=1 Tax=Virgibacillus dakarensis TaxID=1917889 RepID=UPI000B436B42|nr:VOC family protein [Virgibacillus dakarensis]MTW88035.1 VOC family protein [Virgibacillus dakarensis]
MTNTNQIIVPHLWYDKEANEAAEFYASIFPDSRITNKTTLHDTPSGDADLVSFELWGQKFMAINAGPYFTFNPSVSFMVNFDPSREKDASEKLEEVWNKLSEGGTVLMPLDKYPFSEKYGWIQDKYGLSWQLILTDPEGEVRPAIVPSLMFVGDTCGKAEEAINFYLSVFKNSKQGLIARYPQEMEPDKEGTIMFSDYMLENQWFAVMDSARDHKFSFNEAISFMIYCDTQAEIDDYWDKLSAVPESEQCGWLKDKFGVSWQVVPKEMDEMMTSSTPQQIDRVNKATLKMKKLDLAELQKVYKG